MTDRLQEAVSMYIYRQRDKNWLRQIRRCHRVYINKGRTATTYGAIDEQPCCKGIKHWGRHICTAKHVASLFGVDRCRLIAEAKTMMALDALEQL